MKKNVIGIMFLLILLSFSLFGCTRTINNSSSSYTNKSTSSSLNQTSSSTTSSESLSSSVTESSSGSISINSSVSGVTSNNSSLEQAKFTVYIESSIVNGSITASQQEVERGGTF